MTKITYICDDKDCKVRVTTRRFKLKDVGVYWAVCPTEDELWEHSFSCEKVVNVPLKAVAAVMKDVRASGKELINILRERNFNIGGSQVKQCAITQKEHVYAYRLATKIDQIRNDNGDINMLPGILGY